MLLDDVGFGASSAFGGPCQTPTAERLAANGLKHNRFHTTAICSPTRQALLTGRNHHIVGMGGITEFATSAPGNCSIRPKSCAPLAETLKVNGYATAQIGKCHEVPVWETSPAGPYNAWPIGSGFEYFYGFVCAETNQYYPALYEGTSMLYSFDDAQATERHTTHITSRRAYSRSPLECTRCAWSSPTTAAAWARAVACHSSLTASRSEKAGSDDPALLLFCRRDG